MANRSTQFTVLMTEGAEQDLEAIHDYISEFDRVAKSATVCNPSRFA